jgi:hypothetical protein
VKATRDRQVNLPAFGSLNQRLRAGDWIIGESLIHESIGAGHEMLQRLTALVMPLYESIRSRPAIQRF